MDSAPQTWIDALAGADATPIWLRRRLASWLGYREVHVAPLPGGCLRVWERGTCRHLRFGDAWEDQSVLDRADPLRLVLPYSRDAALGLALPPRLDAVLHVGLGGGTLARVVHHVAPGARQIAVEPHAAVVDAARRWFALPDAVTTVSAAAEALGGRYDLVFWDAFSAQGAEIVVTEAELAAIRRALGEDGWLVVNATDGAAALSDRLRGTFACVGRVRLPDIEQHVIFAGDRSDGARARANALGEQLGLGIVERLDRVVWTG